MKRYLAAACALSLLIAAPIAAEAKVKAHPAKPVVPAVTAPAPVVHNYPAPEAAIASTVVVPPGYTTVYVSGMVPDVADLTAPAGSYAAYGSTEVQTESVLAKLDAALKAQGCTFGDVVSMHVFLVGDPALDNKLDFAGMMKAYKRHFGTPDQPNRPTRATVQVAALAAPGFLVEIEVIAVKAAK